MARTDHWVKNVFVLPGTLVALALDPGRVHVMNWLIAGLGLLAVCLVTSSNYVLNEILDAPFDRLHPYKRNRPVAAGRVLTGAAYAEWLLLMAAGVGLGVLVSRPFALSLAGLWLAGLVYNVPPLRTKDVPYVDVLSEAVNNPLRMLAGWYLTGTSVTPVASLLVSYWMAGCYFMVIKRYSEFHELTRQQLVGYRKSFAAYSERSLLVSVMFYASGAMLFFGAFLARYRLELILSFPLIATVMALYLWLAFQNHSPVQNPEVLYREPLVIVPVLLCAAVMAALLFVDLPFLHSMFPPSVAGF